MTKRTTDRFTLPELAAAAAGQLAAAEVDQQSARVSEVPSSRTIRYYATHGLLDSPVEWEGRTAIYGRRHLLQLVAIKRLQAKGMKLAAIQQRLHGMPDEELARLARVDEKDGAGAPPARKLGSRSRGAFWATRGSEISREQSDTPGPASPKAREGGEVGAVRLGDDVLLVIEELTRTMDEDDRHALRVAAEPLLHMLEARRLVGKGRSEGGE